MRASAGHDTQPTRPMQNPPLSPHWQHIRVGRPLPLNIRDADGTLLLARGQFIASPGQLQTLKERGVLFDSGPVGITAAQIQQATPEQLPALWGRCMEGVAHALRGAQKEHFRAALDDAAVPVLALIARDPDLAIFQVVRQQAGALAEYGVNHSVHTAITSRLVAQRLGWDEAQLGCVFKAALTMNLSMVELQGWLATQVTPLTALQREAIRTHPTRSVEMLEKAGITNRDWLDAVAQHHEKADGSGYPGRLREVGEIASLLRRVDIYTAKLSPRSTRSALAANRAGREIFMQDPGHPMNNAIVKEFGVYPPGCFVLLASGETGVVVKRGPSANTPLVASLTGSRGEPLPEPLRRDTAVREHQIVDTVAEHTLKVRVSPETLALLAAA
jgi:HD-GYP domain-containing protein (c-di-GMP phosphodiesterase class II)